MAKTPSKPKPPERREPEPKEPVQLAQTDSTDTPPSAPQGGSDNPVAPADPADTDASQGREGGGTGPTTDGPAAPRFDVYEAEFRQTYPLLSAAIDAWRVDHEGPPSGIRVRARQDGFRRAGIAHPAAWVEHPFDSDAEMPITGPAGIEQLMAEPKLQVELI